MTAYTDLAPFLVISSSHDYRSPRKTNVHFIAREFARLGATRFLSIGYSPISHLKPHDPRSAIISRANRTERHDGVDCFLWKTLWHPFNPRNKWLGRFSAALTRRYAASISGVPREWITTSRTIMIESGLGIALIPEIARLNPTAKIVYNASDELATIGCDPCLQELLAEVSPLISRARVPSRLLREPGLRVGDLRYIPHGNDTRRDDPPGPSPFTAPINGVSIGSMLFDPGFFEIACRLYPDITFHVIGCGVPRSALPPQVHFHDEMPYEDTVPFIRHASFGIAPYRLANVPDYLRDTSMKLLQYDHLRLPSVCPEFAIGPGHSLRCGYIPGDANSIRVAIARATRKDRKALPPSPSWANVAERLLMPDYVDAAS